MTDRRTFAESYTVAAGAQDLTVRKSWEGVGAVDVIVAAAWSRSALGAALLRLCNQWEVERPPRHEPRSVEDFEDQGYTRERAALEHQREADVFSEAQYRQTAALIARLRDLPAVRERLAAHAASLGMTDPDLKAAAVVRFWLDKVCAKCEGRGFELFPGTQRRSDRACPSCLGSRFGTIPYGEDGLRLAEFLKSCQGRAKSAIRRNLGNRVGQKDSGRCPGGPQASERPEDGDSYIRAVRRF